MLTTLKIGAGISKISPAFQKIYIPSILILTLFVTACAEKDEGSNDTLGSGGWVIIESPTTDATYISESQIQGIGGRAFTNTDFTQCSIGCDPHNPGCRECTPGVTVTWSNALTDNSGIARNGFRWGDCIPPDILPISCEVIHGWHADVCLAQGDNLITITASDLFGNKGEDSITVTSNFKSVPPASAPVSVKAVAGPGRATLSWAANPTYEHVNTYTLYMAETSWTTWSDTLPGAIQRAGITCCTFTQMDLINGVTYWAAITASGCERESEESVQVSVTPESAPITLSLDANEDGIFGDSSDVMIPGISKTYEAIIEDEIGDGVYGVTVSWASSALSTATLSSVSSVTDAMGVATVTISALDLGEAIIKASVEGTAINSSISLSVVAPLSGNIKIDAGRFYTCFLTAAGGVKCLGSNSNGQLGDGTFINRLTLVDVVGLTSGVSTIGAMNEHTCAVTTAGGAKCWGKNDSGQIGDGTSISRLTPVDVLGLTSGVSEIGAGGFHTCANTFDYFHYPGGGVKCWGNGAVGQLGDGTSMNRLTPVAVVGSSGPVKAITAGLSHTCAVTTIGSVACWGSNSDGQLGDGTSFSRPTPVWVVGMTDGAIAITAGDDHTCTVTTAGGAKCWGENDSGQIGDGTSIARLTPVDVLGLTSGVSEIDAGVNHTCVVTTAGRVKCWGSNFYGQLGDGSGIDRLTPVDVAGLTGGVSSIAAGGYHTCAVITAGGVKCWGRNVSGQLGDGTTIDRISPVDVIAP